MTADNELRRRAASDSFGEARQATGHDGACCEELARKISDYHDGRWSAGQAGCVEVDKLREHLATCPRCAELLEDYRAITGALQRFASPVATVECTTVQIERIGRRVRARLRRQVMRRRLAWTGAGVGVAAAAAVAVALIARTTLPGPGEAAGAPAGGRLAADETTHAPGAGEDSQARPGGVSGRGDGTAPAVGLPLEAGPGRRERENLLRDLEAEERVRPAPGVVRVGEGRRAGEAAPGRDVKPPALRPVLLGLLLASVRTPREGARVVSVARVVAGSPASAAGFLPGDLLLRIGDEKATSPDKVAELVEKAGPGAKIKITYARGGKVRETGVVLAGGR